jgi:hypothetical protein
MEAKSNDGVTPPVKAQGLAVAALVVGIVAFISGWVPFWGFLTGVAAVVLGIIALRRKAVSSAKGMAIAGLVTGAVGALWSGIVTIFFIIAIALGVAQTATTAAHLSDNSTASTAKNIPATRTVSGTQATLGAGTFTVGKDVQPGVYDVTPGSGQSGNFSVDGQNQYNEILGTSDGFGVSKVRVQLTKDDSVKIEGLSQVIFTPVTSTFVKEYKATSLYTGDFIVGEDIAAGRYVVTPGSGQSGNFSVSGANEYNEILGSDYGVANVTVTLSTGDVVSISGLDQVNFAVVQ